MFESRVPSPESRVLASLASPTRDPVCGKMATMKLDSYQSCSPTEKRQVLGVFWRSEDAPSIKVAEGAVEYGPVAVICIIIIAVELLALAIVGVVWSMVWGWFFCIPLLLALLSLWKAIMRTRELQSPGSASAAGGSPA